MKLFLTDTAPDQLELAPGDVWIEVRGARGEFQLDRLDAGVFTFRKSVAEGHSIGESAGLALDVDETFDPGHALAALLTGVFGGADFMTIVSVRDRLGRFPLSIIQPRHAHRRRNGFLQSRILKYQSFEFAVKLFEDEYRLPFSRPGRGRAYGNDQRTHDVNLLFLGLATRLITLPLFGMISVIQIFVYPTAWPDHVLWGSILLFLLTAVLDPSPSIISSNDGFPGLPGPIRRR